MGTIHCSKKERKRKGEYRRMKKHNEVNKNGRPVRKYRNKSWITELRTTTEHDSKHNKRSNMDDYRSDDSVFNRVFVVDDEFQHKSKPLSHRGKHGVLRNRLGKNAVQQEKRHKRIQTKKKQGRLGKLDKQNIRLHSSKAWDVWVRGLCEPTLDWRTSRNRQLQRDKNKESRQILQRWRRITGKQDKRNKQTRLASQRETYPDGIARDEVVDDSSVRFGSKWNWDNRYYNYLARGKSRDNRDTKTSKFGKRANTRNTTSNDRSTKQHEVNMQQRSTKRSAASIG